MNILKILVLLVFVSFDQSAEECSNIYLIRHAEKLRTDKERKITLLFIFFEASHKNKPNKPTK